MLGLFCLISLAASAEDYSGSCGNNAQWSFDTTTGLLSITGSGKMNNYSDYSYVPWYRYRNDIISLSIGDQITSIGDFAFYGCSGLTSVTIPNSVTSIGDYAFSGCSGLTSVTIGSSVTSIGNEAFKGCNNVKELIYAEGTKIVLRTYLTSITSVTIPNSVTSIEEEAFQRCSGLTSVTIPNSVILIGSYAFEDCSGLTSVTIPNSVKEIGGGAFKGCSGLTNPVYNNTIFAYMPTSYSDSYSIPDGITTIAVGAFSGCSGLTSVTIPNSVTSIGYDAFSDCSGLTSVTIPNSVTSIGGYAFEGCSGLTSVTIPNSVTSIGSSAFSGCKGLTSVSIGNSVTSIGSSAFRDCSGLTSVTIPNSVTSIGESAFYGCSGLTSVYVEWKDAGKIPSIDNRCFPFSTCDLYVPTGTKTIYQGKDYWNTFRLITEGIKVSIEDKDGNDASFVVEKSIMLHDNINSISVPRELEDVNITYTRNFDKAGVWQAWYMPFGVDFDDMKDAYDVAQIHGVLLDKDNNAVLAFLKLDKGTVNANTSYVVRPKKSGEVAITTTTDLQPTQSNSFLMMSATDKYTIGGVFEKTTTPGNWYALNLDGQFQLMGSGVYLRPFRIYMTIDPRTDNPYAQSASTTAKMDIVVIGDGETTGIESLTPALSEGKEAIYNLSGLRVNSIQKGQIYIMNGKKYIAK